MKNWQFALALTLLLLRANSEAVIFETDNRIEAQTQTTPFWRKRAKSVVALIPNKKVQKEPNGSYKLKGHEKKKKSLYNFAQMPDLPIKN
jgi:hypothetical protein